MEHLSNPTVTLQDERELIASQQKFSMREKWETDIMRATCTGGLTHEEAVRLITGQI
jgi:hypothetical protein